MIKNIPEYEFMMSLRKKIHQTLADLCQGLKKKNMKQIDIHLVIENTSEL